MPDMKDLKIIKRSLLDYNKHDEHIKLREKIMK